MEYWGNYNLGARESLKSSNKTQVFSHPDFKIDNGSHYVTCYFLRNLLYISMANSYSERSIVLWARFCVEGLLKILRFWLF